MAGRTRERHVRKGPSHVKADRIFTNAKIFTADSDTTIASALAVKDGTFVYVGDEQGLADFEGEVPGAAPKDCGNYLLHDLPMAKWESAKYLHEVLEKITYSNLHYPEQ
jgi:hypothetical protein